MGHEEIHLNHIGVVDFGFYLHYMNYLVHPTFRVI